MWPRAVFDRFLCSLSEPRVTYDSEPDRQGRRTKAPAAQQSLTFASLVNLALRYPWYCLTHMDPAAIIIDRISRRCVANLFTSDMRLM